MTGGFEDRDPLERDPLDGASDEDVDARFAAIVSGLNADLHWAADPAGLDKSAADMASGSVGRATRDLDRHLQISADPAAELAAERERRRALRRAERAEQVAAFEAEQARRKAELEADQEHFVPPDPPPLQRLRRRTVVALLLLVAGVVLSSRPDLVEVAPDAVRILGVIILLSSIALLFSLLRKRSGDAADGDGWDDGARL